MSTEYFAQQHSASTLVLELKEEWDGTNGIGIRRKLNALIKVHPDLIEAYNFRRGILEHEDHLTALDKETVRAYEAVIVYYFPDGALPDSMPWGWLENRPILTALTYYATLLWIQKKDKEARKLFSKLLQMNPNDNMGVRYLYLALLEDIGMIGYQELLKRNELHNWFDALASRHKELSFYAE